MCPDLIYRIVPYGIPPRLKMTPEQRITPQIHRTLADRFTMPVSCRLSEKVHNPQNAAVTLLQTTTGTKIEIGVSAKVHEYFTAKGTGATAHLLEKDQQLQLGYLLDNTLVAIVKMIPTSYKR